MTRDYDDIPGTFVFDGARSRMGYRLNMFCMSLLDAANRDAFRSDEDTYLDRFQLTLDQRAAVRSRNWIAMLELGGNIYYTYKIGACDGLSFQQVAAAQTGVTEDEYVSMMVAGGRSVEGNRSRSDSPGGEDAAADRG